VEEEANLNELQEKFGRLATPTIIIDDEVFVGFQNNIEQISALTHHH